MPKACTWCGRPNEGGVDFGKQLKPNSLNKDLKIKIEHFWFEFCGTCQFMMENEFKEGNTLRVHNYFSRFPESWAAQLRMKKRFVYKN